MDKNMKTRNFLISLLLVSLFCWSSLAQEQQKPVKTPRVTHRQINQQARIKQGVRSGELTKGETIRLEKEQAKIQADKKKAKADGEVTPQEHRHIKKEQNKASRHIRRLKHNDQTRK
jgi:hypothetical protein